ncbi:transposase, partial [Deinococcus antarcticus]
MPGRMHSREFKLEVLEQIERKQKTTAQVCREHQLSPSLIHRWRKELKNPALKVQGFKVRLEVASILK